MEDGRKRDKQWSDGISMYTVAISVYRKFYKNRSKINKLYEEHTQRERLMYL